MNDIEERAREWCNGIINRLDTSDLERGYIQGAVEQKSIDIDKACEWISQYLFEIGFPDDWCRDSKVMKPNGEQRFRKAMEAI